MDTEPFPPEQKRAGFARTVYNLYAMFQHGELACVWIGAISGRDTTAKYIKS
jgi:hypothetical protein